MLDDARRWTPQLCRAQVAQLRRSTAEAAQAARRAEAARENALAEAARSDGVMQELRARLDDALRYIWSQGQP